MINQLTLYPEITLNDEHIEKINKIYGRVAQKTMDLGKKSKHIISEMVFSPGSLGKLLRSEPQMLPQNYSAKDDKLVIVGRSRASKAASKFARLLKLKK